VQCFPAFPSGVLTDISTDRSIRTASDRCPLTCLSLGRLLSDA